MNISDQVCSLELAKRLKELGVKQESFFYYGRVENSLFKETHHDVIIYEALWELNELFSYCPEYSAFTSAELGEIIPNVVTLPNCEPFDNFKIVIRKFFSVDDERNLINNFIINYECDSTEVTGERAWLSRKLTNNFYDKNEANARALMLIHLIENGLVKNEI